tara:strand:- start:208 stop:429 length:222 start_codon:yes stop_codon:yes gene_type:complete
MISQKNNLIMNFGLGVSFVGIALYDPLGLLFTGMGLIFVGIGLTCIYFGYRQLNEVEMINKAVESFEKNRRKQ